MHYVLTVKFCLISRPMVIIIDFYFIEDKSILFKYNVYQYKSNFSLLQNNFNASTKNIIKPRQF